MLLYILLHVIYLSIYLFQPLSYFIISIMHILSIAYVFLSELVQKTNHVEY